MFLFARYNLGSIKQKITVIVLKSTFKKVFDNLSFKNNMFFNKPLKLSFEQLFILPFSKKLNSDTNENYNRYFYLLFI